MDNKTNYHHRTSSRSQPHQAAVSRCGVPAVARGSGHRLDNVDSWWSIAVSRDHDTRRQLCVVDWWATSGRRHETTDNLHYAAASSRLTLYSAKLIIVPHRIICSWHAGRWRVDCYILYSEEETGRSRSPPRPFLAVPNVTVRSLTACSAPITVLRHNGPLLCGFNVLVKGLIGVVTVSSLEPPTTGDRLLK